ncbi:transcription antitermination factor NusB [Bacillus salitolerans]|uniref:Transcription antitermination protein NusB n=1 Tax=Bacillus salitolerans TaxID=1437434 RepID=A0ABW4LNQ7_9BACI
MNRRTAREKAIQTLFQLDLNELDPREAIQNVLEEEQSNQFLEQLVLGTLEQQTDIDHLIKNNLEKWSMERIGKIDRAILRMAVYEMKYLDEIPVNVSMNEAIELAKVFGDDDSSKFINSVLSKIKDNLNA